MHHPVEGAEREEWRGGVPVFGRPQRVKGVLGAGKGAGQDEVGGVTGSVDNSGEGCNLARPGSWH